MTEDITEEELSENSFKNFPFGTILTWDPIKRDLNGQPTGGTRKVPRGWRICDGNNGTPDLRGYFLKGVSSADMAGKKGGSEHFIYEHDHDMEHRHSVNIVSNYHSRVDNVPLGGNHDPRNHNSFVTGSTNLWNQAGDYARPGVTGETSEASRLRTSTESVTIPIDPSHYTVLYIMRVGRVS